MLRVLTIGMLMTLGAAAGLYGQRFMSDNSYAEFGVIFPDPDPKFAAEFTLDRGWGCTGIANRADGLDVTTVILDLRTLKGVVSYTGQGMLGMKGRSVLVSCE